MPDLSQPYGYNPLRGVRSDLIPLAASGLMEAFKKLWADAWGVRMEHILRNALYALIGAGDAVLTDVLSIISDKGFRRQIVSRVKNEQVRAFWTKEYAAYNPRYSQESIAPIQNKLGAFLADPRLYRMFTGDLIDLHLQRGDSGRTAQNVLGALLLTTLGLRH